MKIALLANGALVSLGITISSVAFAQSDIMSTILANLSSRVQRFENSCGEDIKKYCTTVTPGGGRTVYCMQAHEDKISAQCAFELTDVEAALQETAEELKQAVNVCRGDIEKLCANVQSGGGRIAACLAANRTSVSQTCVQAVEKIQVK